MSILTLDRPKALEEQSEDLFVWKEVIPVQVTPLRGEEYPLLVALWDNADDAIYDTL